MRVASSTLYQQGLASMNNQQGSLMYVQQQLGTGRRILTPSDDPVAATRALSVSQAQAVNGQYATSRTQATSSLSMEENALQTVTMVVHNIQQLLVQAGNGTMSDNDRASVATALQGQYDQLLGLANADDGNGQFLFAGVQSGTAPFANSAAGGVVYNGDTGQQLLQVDVARAMAAGDDGRAVFQSVTSAAGYVLQGNGTNTGTATYSAVSVTNPSDPLYGHAFSLTFQPDPATGKMQYTVTDQTTVPPTVGTPTNYTDGAAIQVAGITFSVKGTPNNGDTMTMKPATQAGTDMFANLQTVIKALKAPVVSAADGANLANTIATTNRQFSNSLDNVLTVRSSVGSRLQELDALNTVGTNRNLNYTQSLSALQDLDYASAIGEYYQRQTALQAAQSSFMQIQGMNLFKYL